MGFWGFGAQSDLAARPSVHQKRGTPGYPGTRVGTYATYAYPGARVCIPGCPGMHTRLPG